MAVCSQACTGVILNGAALSNTARRFYVRILSDTGHLFAHDIEKAARAKSDQRACPELRACGCFA
jgi:hypothetical protein